MGSGGVLRADANARLPQFYYGDWEHRVSGKILARKFDLAGPSSFTCAEGYALWAVSMGAEQHNQVIAFGKDHETRWRADAAGERQPRR